MTGYGFNGGSDDETTQLSMDNINPQVVNLSDTLHVSTNYSGFGAHDIVATFVDWGDGKGNQSLGFGGGSINASRPMADLSPGVHTGTLSATEVESGDTVSKPFTYHVNGNVLLIDSNNDDGMAAPTPANTPADEQKIANDANKPGKLVTVNSADKNSDGVPDFAEGFGNYADVTPTADEGAGFVPVTVALPEWIDAAHVSLSLTYSASNPNDISVSGSGTTADPYIFHPAAGDLRIWTKDESQSRDAASVADGGDWVKSGESFDGSKLTWNGNLATLWVEAITTSAAIGDRQIKATLIATAGALNGSGANSSVRLTAFDTQLVEATADGKGTQPATTADYSSPTPNLTVSYLTFSNVHASSGGIGILGSIIIRGTVQSDVADVTAGDLGKIKNVDVYVNGDVFPIAEAPVSGQKLVDLTSFTKPYPFVSATDPAQPATFQLTIPSVSLQPGNNVITVAAADPVYGATGYAKADEGIDLSSNAPLVNGRPDYSKIRFTLGPYTPGDKSYGSGLDRYAYQVLAPAGTFDSMGYVETNAGRFRVVQSNDNKYYLSQIGHSFSAAVSSVGATNLPGGKAWVQLAGEGPTISDAGNGMSNITYTLQRVEMDYSESGGRTTTYKDLGTHDLLVPAGQAAAWKQYINLLVEELGTLDDLSVLKGDAALFNFALRAVPFGTLAGDSNDHTLSGETAKHTTFDAVLTFSPMLLARPLRAGITVVGAATAASERVIEAEIPSVLRGGTTEIATDFGVGATPGADGTFTNLGNPYLAELPTGSVSASSGGVTVSTAGEGIHIEVGELNGFWRQVGPAQVNLRTLARSASDYQDVVLKSALHEDWVPIVLEKTTTYPRVYGIWPADATNGFAGQGAGLVGRYLSTTTFSSADAARASLAILDDFNAATRIGEATLPPGTVVFESIVAPQTSLVTGQTLSGGGIQILLPDDYLLPSFFKDIGPLQP
jgi:hypothetical protein